MAIALTGTSFTATSGRAPLAFIQALSAKSMTTTHGVASVAFVLPIMGTAFTAMSGRTKGSAGGLNLRLNPLFARPSGVLPHPSIILTDPATGTISDVWYQFLLAVSDRLK